MKTEPLFPYSYSPLKIAEENFSSTEKPLLRVVEKAEFKNQRFSFIDNKAIDDSTNWDASWFANYE